MLYQLWTNSTLNCMEILCSFLQLRISIPEQSHRDRLPNHSLWSSKRPSILPETYNHYRGLQVFTMERSVNWTNRLSINQRFLDSKSLNILRYQAHHDNKTPSIARNALNHILVQRSSHDLRTTCLLLLAVSHQACHQAISYYTDYLKYPHVVQKP